MRRKPLFPARSSVSIVGRACIALLAAFACFVPAGTAQARSFDSVDIAVEAFATAGPVAGISIGPAEKELVKGVVRCGVGGKSALDCARDELVKRLPAEVQPFAGCIANGQSIEQCATTQAISQLHPQLRGAANCIAAGNNIAQCGRQFATDQASQAKLAALNEASATLDKLKADALGKSSLVSSPGPVQSIIGVAQGIEEGNAAKVLLHGSPELLKIAGRIILRAFLPGPLASLLGPASDALIQNRFDLVVGIAKAAEAGDERRLGELAVEALVYLNLPVAQACGLMPDGGAREAICGFVADVIGTVAKGGGKLATEGVDTLRDVCTGLGFDCSSLLGNDPSCGTPQSFYAKNFPVCVKHGASSPKTYAQVEYGLNGRCREHFRKCNEQFLVGGTSERLDGICNPLREAFKRQVDKLNSTLLNVASRYADSYPPIRVKEKVERLPDGGLKWSCDYGGRMQKFIPDCAKALEAQFPELRADPNCGDWPLPHADIFMAVCDTLYQRQVGRSMADKAVCEPGEVPPEPCRPPASIQSDGTCAIVYRDPPCPPGQVYSAVQQRCVNPDAPPPVASAPPSPPSGLPPPPSVTQPPIVSLPPPLPPSFVTPPPGPCTPGLPKSRGGCGCLPGTYEANGRCNAYNTAEPAQPPPIVRPPPRTTFVDPLPPKVIAPPPPIFVPLPPRVTATPPPPRIVVDPLPPKVKPPASRPSAPPPGPVATLPPPVPPACAPGVPKNRGGCGCPAGTYGAYGKCNRYNESAPAKQAPTARPTRPTTAQTARPSSAWRRYVERRVERRQRAAQTAQRYRHALQRRVQRHRAQRARVN
jgi:hypothetical protein